MTREEIIRMAREAGYGLSLSDMHAPALERFANLVSAAEREACAKLAESPIHRHEIAEKIRARGEE